MARELKRRRESAAEKEGEGEKRVKSPLSLLGKTPRKTPGKKVCEI